jgi:hypothetical protein
MSTARRSRTRRVLVAVAFATLAFSVHAADAAASFLTINDVTMNEGNSGTTAYVFTVTLTVPPPPPPNVMVHFATGGGTATPGTSCTGGADYVHTEGNLTFNTSQMTRMIIVPVCGDTAFEPTEAFLVNLSGEPFGVIVTKRQGVGVIVNDDASVRSTSTTVDCPATTAANSPASCTVRVRDTSAGTPSPPLGTVDFAIPAQPAGSTAMVGPDPCALTPDTTTVATDDSTCTITFTANTVGNYTIRGTYQPAPASVHTGSTGSDTIQVTARTTSTSVECPASTPANTPTTCTVTVTDTDSGTKSPPLGDVDFAIPAQPAGSTATVTPDPCALTPDTTTVATDDSTCTVTFTANTVGNYTITGTYQPAPASVHTGSTGSDTIQVRARTTSTSVECPASTPANTPTTCTVTVTDTDSGTKSPPLGDVDFAITASPAGSTAMVGPDPCALTPDTTTVATDDSTCTVTFTANTVGNYTIRGTYQPAPASVHATSNGSDTIEVTARTTKTEVTCTPSSFQAGDPTTCTATVSDTDANPRSTPTGTVTWTSSESTGAFVPDSCPLGSTDPLDPAAPASCSVTYSSTTASQQTITASYGGDLTHEASSDSTTVTVNPGPPATVTLRPLAAHNQVDTRHCVTATVEDRFGNRTPGISVVFTVTGSNSTSGSDTTDAVGEAEFCYRGRLFGLDTIDAFADTDNDGTRDPGEPSAIPPATKLWLVPASTPLCEVEFPTGGGHIVADNGDRGSFGGNAHVSPGGEPTGQQEYQDHGPVQPLNAHSINVLAVVCVRFPDRAEATIFGEATIDGMGRHPYRIDVEDRGEPGTDDTYWITLANGYNSGRHPLEGGNITIH